MRSLPREFFKPRSVAVVGVSKKGGFGSGIAALLRRLGYEDRLYLVTPREDGTGGPRTYRRLDDLPETPDLVIVIVPRDAVPGVMEDCISKDVRAVIIESAGFAETDEEGARLERDIERLIRGSDMRVIGPNCVGLINPHDRFASTEAAVEEMPAGTVAVIAQSGVFGNILADWAPGQDLAVSALVTIGNRVDVDETDMLYHFCEDQRTDVIVLYLEGAKDGVRFREALTRASRRKPVLVYKSGRTEAGKRATASHTGSLSGQDALYEGLFRQSGAVRASSFQELFDLARVFARQPLMKGTDVGIVTSSGSLGVMAADAAFEEGFRLPQLSPASVAALRSQAPPWMNVKNPLDVGPSPLFGAGLETLLREGGIDGIIAVPVIPDAVMKSLMAGGIEPAAIFGDPGAIRRSAPEKPVITYTIGSADWMAMVRTLFGPHMTVVGSAETAAKALWALHRYHRFRSDSGGNR